MLATVTWTVDCALGMPERIVGEQVVELRLTEDGQRVDCSQGHEDCSGQVRELQYSSHSKV